MQISIPGLEITEPVKSRPFSGSALGTITGAGFGLLTGGKAFPSSWASQAIGYVLGGLVIGMIVGFLLPLFRRRVLAGIVVGAAVTCGLLVAQQYWGETWGVPETIFVGASQGFIYARLLWKYYPPANSVAAEPVA